MSILEDAISRLMNHANYPSDLAAEDSLLYQLWNQRNRGSEVNTSQQVYDVINCLEIINSHLNGTSPENISYEDKKQSIDRRIVLAMQTILYTVQYSNESPLCDNDEMAKYHFYLAYAWMDVLSGDIDSIKDNVKDAAVLRNLLLS